MSRPRSICVVSCDLFFIFTLIFIVIDHIASLKVIKTDALENLENLRLSLDNNLDEESK